MFLDLATIKSYLGETTADYDAFLTSQGEIVTSAIENYCGRKFESASYTQTFYYSDFMNDVGKDKLFLYHYPLTAVAEIRAITRSSGVDTSNVLDAEKYRIRGDRGTILRHDEGIPRSWFIEDDITGNGRYEVDFTAGYATLPYEIQDAYLNLIEERYNKKKSGIAINFGSDVQRLSIPGTFSIDFDYTLQNNERKSRFGVLLKEYLNVLDYYRSERSLIGEIKENYVS